MSFRSAREHFEDIQESIENIYAFIAGMDFKSYKNDRKTRSAVERELQIITEASIRLGEDGDRLSPGPDWNAIVSLPGGTYYKPGEYAAGADWASTNQDGTLTLHGAAPAESISVTGTVTGLVSDNIRSYTGLINDVGLIYVI